VCVKCNATCVNCAYISTNCSLCTSTGNNSAFLYDDGTTYPKCLIICPAAFYSYVNGSTRLCNPCDLGCANCTNTSGNCSLCIASYGLINTTCYNPCPAGHFLHNSACDLCSTPCVECTGSDITCTVCEVTGSGKKYLYNNTCMSNCPIGYYNFDNTTVGPTVCLSCDFTCSACSINSTYCSTCSTSYYLFNSTCLLICPANYFPYAPTKTCIISSSVGVSLAMSISMTSSLN